QASVVLTGADTVLADNARRTVRADELGREAEQTGVVMSRAPLRGLVEGRRGGGRTQRREWGGGD
ncbi:hypothetical protein B1218_38175, partial [Pseudomonas ogarae]